MAQPCPAPVAALPHLVKTSTDRFFDAAAVQEFYEKWGESCAWSDQAAGALLARIAHVAEDGLDPGFFDTGGITSRTPPHDILAARERDLMLSDLALRYARVMSLGAVDLSKIDNDIYFPHRKPDLTASLADALVQGHISDWLEGLPPRSAAYRQLKDMLAFYRHLQKNGGWQMLPPGPTLKPGEDSPLLPELRRRLMVEGDLTTPVEGSIYDAATVEALKHFQARHGLTPDGALGSKTGRMLNIPVEIWIDQIIANLDRRRYIGSSLPLTRFEVNVAAGEAELISDGTSVLSMRAIVGKPENPTPMLLSAINEVIINPSWTVPFSIIRNEIPPRLRHDPTYLARNKMRWVQGMLVQAPGPENPLGRVKFNFSNPFSVYLHDTPATQLFALNDRARSHGCIRLERPLELADFLLQSDPAWPRQQIEDAVAAHKTVHIALPTRLPVAVVYWTAFVDPDGAFELRDDIYGRDARLIRALAHGHGLTALP